MCVCEFGRPPREMIYKFMDLVKLLTLALFWRLFKQENYVMLVLMTMMCLSTWTSYM